MHFIHTKVPRKNTINKKALDRFQSFLFHKKKTQKCKLSNATNLILGAFFCYLRGGLDLPPAAFSHLK